MKITKKEFNLIRFPNGEFKLVVETNLDNSRSIVWRYDEEFRNGEKLNSPAEHLVALLYLDRLIGEVCKRPKEILTDYMPFRRQDKRKLLGETTFDNWDKGLENIKLIETIPHNKIDIGTINEVNTEIFLKHIHEQTQVVIFPDEGATKRFNVDAFGITGVCFTKTRDEKTGELKFEDLSEFDKSKVKDCHCTIIDDIIAYGGTFKHIATELKKYGAKRVDLIVNHSDGVFKEKDLKEAGIDNIIVMNAIKEY